MASPANTASSPEPEHQLKEDQSATEESKNTSPEEPDSSKTAVVPQAQDDEGQSESGTAAGSSKAVVESSDADAEIAPAAPPNEWQAIWSPQYNAYYFFNSRTQETTWTNPLQPEDSKPDTNDATTSAVPEASTSASASVPASTPSEPKPLIDPSNLNGIDPALAYLDPTLYVPSGAGGPQTFTAKFNARTGRFTAGADARDPSYLSEAERAKRMSSVFFDVDQWEKDVAKRKAEDEAEGSDDKRKRPTKKDLDRWKEAKKQKKIAKHAWLRN